jgi:lipopolysaccharide/colanic/teichoic acid biosynthesis glycosyltransferase
MRSFYLRRGKRICDVTLCALAAAVLAPVAFVVAVAVYLSLGRPVIFTQRRVGLRGRTFTLLKFRTMASSETAAVADSDADRITKTGEFLRRSSLDELPQLVNVLRGDMSFVGPRPLLPEYLPRYTAAQAKRHDVMPGLTGLAQVNGRNTISWKEKFDLDLQYVRDVSFALDARILAQTLLRILRGTGTSHPGHATMPEFRG